MSIQELLTKLLIFHIKLILQTIKFSCKYHIEIEIIMTFCSETFNRLTFLLVDGHPSKEYDDELSNNEEEIYKSKLRIIRN